MLDVPIPAIFETLQIYLGSAYVNDFNPFGRVYQVRAQADQRFRLDSEDIIEAEGALATGALVPLGTLVEIREVTGPDLVQRYNMFPSVPLQATAAPGVSSGQALDAMEQLARAGRCRRVRLRVDRARLPGEAAGNTAVFIFALSVLFVFLVLAAQYESWSLPLAIILIVPMACSRRFVGVMLRGMDNNILTQIGLVVLIGLAAKNAILIVEFAKQAEDRGMPPVDAVVEAARCGCGRS